MEYFDVRYLWVAAGEKCKGTYKGKDKEDVIKRLESEGNEILSIKQSKHKRQVARL